MKLNRNQIKYTVIVAMLIDHIAWAFVPTASPLGQIMHFIGRLTGPTMAFFLAEGYVHTRSFKKYALRMGLFALISWPPFSYFETGRWFAPRFGVIYTLFLGLLAIRLYDEERLHPLVRAVGVFALCMLSVFGDWAVYLVLWPLYLYVFRDEPRTRWGVFCLLGVFVCAEHFIYAARPLNSLWCLGIFTVPPMLIYLYDGSGGSRHPFHKWFFYIFYPAHLLALGLLQWGF